MVEDRVIQSPAGLHKGRMQQQLIRGRLRSEAELHHSGLAFIDPGHAERGLC